MRKVSGLRRGGFLRHAIVSAAVLAVGLGSVVAYAQQTSRPAGDLNTLVRATLATDNPVIQAGRPIWVDFNLVNQTENRLTLRVPEVSVDATEYSEMGLPVEHLFSGPGFAGPLLQDESGERHHSKATVRPREKVPAIKLAPHGTVGARLELTQYYESLLRPGKYKLTWQPYNGSIASQPLSITVLAERQAVILVSLGNTSLGKMTMRFYYDQAPNHVQNFIELVEERFYDKLMFNRIIPGALIQGGDPQGNRRGIRKDGKRLKAEFNSVPFDIGTVGMCRSRTDPDSASCQFFICLSRQPSFDGTHTAFGYLIGDESFETLHRIAAVPTEDRQGLADYPRKTVFITTISLENVPNRQRGTGPMSPSSQPTISVTPNDTGDSSIHRSRPNRSAGTTHAGGTTVLPADPSSSTSGTSGVTGQGSSSDTRKPTIDLPGLKAKGRVAKRSGTTTHPAGG